MLLFGHFEYYHVAVTSRCSDLLWATVVYLFSDFSTVFSQRLYSLVCLDTEVSSIISAVNQWPDRDFLQCFVQKRKEKNGKTEQKGRKKIILQVFADCICVESFLLHLAMLLTLVLFAFTSLLALSLKISKKLKFIVLGVFYLFIYFPEHVPCSGYACGFLNSLVLTGTFQRPHSPPRSHSPAFLFRPLVYLLFVPAICMFGFFCPW